MILEFLIGGTSTGIYIKIVVQVNLYQLPQRSSSYYTLRNIMSISKCVFLFTVLCAVTVYARSTATSQNTISDEETPRSGSESYMGDLRYMYRIYQDCSAVDMSSCLKLKLLSAMDRVARNYAEVPIIEGVNFVKTSDAPKEDVKTEAEIEASLPRSLTERDTALNDMIFDKVTSFFESHTLQVNPKLFLQGHCINFKQFFTYTGKASDSI